MNTTVICVFIVAVFRHARRCVGDVSNSVYGQTWSVRPAVKVYMLVSPLSPLSPPYLSPRCLWMAMCHCCNSHLKTSRSIQTAIAPTICIFCTVIIAKCTLGLQEQVYRWWKDEASYIIRTNAFLV